jgi:hypothetical protein
MKKNYSDINEIDSKQSNGNAFTSMLASKMESLVDTVSSLSIPSGSYKDMSGAKSMKEKVSERMTQIAGNIPTLTPTYENIDPSTQSNVAMDAVSSLVLIGKSFIAKSQSDQSYNTTSTAEAPNTTVSERMSLSGYDQNYGTFSNK